MVEFNGRAGMNYCHKTDHERFQGVFGTGNGCLACELEQTSMINKRTVRVMVRAFLQLNTIRARDGVPYTHQGIRASVDREYFSSIVDELDKVVTEMTGKSAHCHPELYT